jgi:toxin-antitoxin system PIN domain toxin
MFVVDTNVLIYAADEDSTFCARCRELLEEWRGQASAWYITWGVCYEFLRVITHARVLCKPWSAGSALGFVEALLAAPGIGLLTPTERHAAVLAEVIGELPHLNGNLMHDMQTAVLMREHGIRRIYTRDADFHRFPFLEVIDPVS